MNEKVLSIIDADYQERVASLKKRYRESLPDEKGFSAHNLQRMRQFYELFPTLQNSPQAVAHIVSTPWGAIWRFLKRQNRH